MVSEIQVQLLFSAIYFFQAAPSTPLFRLNNGRFNAVSFGFGLLTAAIAVSFSLWVGVIPPHIFRNRRKVAIFFGDSITQRGWGPETRGYVASMADWWTRKVDVFNRGFSGYNSRWGLEMFANVVLNEHPDIVFCFFGANDAVDTQVLQHVPLPEYKQNVQTMTYTLLRHGITVVLITPPPVFEPDLEEMNRAKNKPIVRDRTNERTKLYANAVIEIATLYNVPYVDIFTEFEGDSRSYLVDGLHFNARGNQRLFEMITEKISASLPQWKPENIPFINPEWFEFKNRL